MKEVTPTDAQKFWIFIETNNPEIAIQLKNRQIINGSIICFQPKTMQ